MTLFLPHQTNNKGTPQPGQIFACCQPCCRNESQLASANFTSRPRCGVSVHTLTRHCPIKPIALGNSKRLERYDVHQLDKWIDTFDEGDTTVNKDWLAALDEDDDSRAHQGN
jgi:hypothetical protein